MLPIPDVEVYAGLVALVVASLPLGAALLRVGERFLGRSVRLHPVERLLLAFYATGGLLFVVASIPVPLYSEATVLGLLVVGAAGYVVFATRDEGRGVRTVGRFLFGFPGVLLAALTLGLLAVEVVGGSLVLPNGIDGTVDSLFVNRLLATHMVPWTLEPYASVGVIYPQGTAVWLSVPVLLFGWPIVATTAVLPPLFLSLSPAAGFCLGERLAKHDRRSPPSMGLLFAGFFALVASWPRLYVGGSFDFILGLPLFLLVLGFLFPLVRAPLSGRWVVVTGILLGTVMVVSTTVGTALALAFLAFWALATSSGLSRPLRQFAGILATFAVAGVFLLRSLVGVALWWSYPGHVMTSNSVPPYSPWVYQSAYSGVVSQVDPFSPWKWKVSPFPVLTLELQVLLVGGLVLGGIVLTRPRGRLARYLSPDLVRWVLLVAATLLLTTIAVALIGAWNSSLSGIQSVTNLWELSILLFTTYSLVALLPLIASLHYLEAHGAILRRTSPVAALPVPPTPSELAHRHQTHRRWRVVLAIVVLVVPLASGLAITGTTMPGYLHGYLLGQSNGTSADVEVLEWAGTHLPSCSGVLAAPGSAAQYLPEYTTFRLIYPVFPAPSNLTYYNVVSSLSNGVYGPPTRAGMLSLGVTEVFVTGATTDTYPAFSVAPLEQSPDFSLLDASGDAYLFAFGPGIAAQGCPPT